MALPIRSAYSRTDVGPTAEGGQRSDTTDEPPLWQANAKSGTSWESISPPGGCSPARRVQLLVSSRADRKVPGPPPVTRAMSGETTRAVRFDHYGGIEVLHVLDVPRPTAAPGQVIVQVMAAAINPGEASIREGLLQQRWPATFPSGEGSDLAGVVTEVGAGVASPVVGDEVLGWTDQRASHAEAVAVPAGQLVRKPVGVSWAVAGSLYVAGVTAWVTVRSVAVKAGDTVAVSAAAGGVGSIAVQLARRAGANVLGIAGPPSEEWLRSVGVTPVQYGDGLAGRLQDAAPQGIDAFIDCFGGGYVDLAVSLGVPVDRIDTITDWEAAGRAGAKTEGLAVAGNPAAILEQLAQLAAAGELEVPIARTYPLEQVQDAYRELEERHTLGKIVLTPTGLARPAS